MAIKEDAVWKEMNKAKYEHEESLEKLNQAKEQYQQVLIAEAMEAISKIPNITEREYKVILGDLVRRTSQMYSK